MQLFSEHLDKKKSLHKDLILYALSLEISFAHIIIIIFFFASFYPNQGSRVTQGGTLLNGVCDMDVRVKTRIESKIRH